MKLPAALLCRLPAPIPDDRVARLCLLAIRRLGTHGLHDEQIVHHLTEAFGSNAGRPLVALKVMMAEISAAASTPLLIAPCCCRRATGAELALLDVITRTDSDPASAQLLLADLLGNRRVDAAMQSVLLVARAFADAGRPLR